LDVYQMFLFNQKVLVSSGNITYIYIDTQNTI